MPKTYSCPIQKFGSQISITLSIETGRSLVVVGANGSGKTRLAVHLESNLPQTKVHRISAQKSLDLKDDVSLVSFDRAERALRTGNHSTPDELSTKLAYRWRSRPAVQPLDDFEALLQALFAEQNRIAVQHLHEHQANPNAQPPATKLSVLKKIWGELLPHRELQLCEASIVVLPRSRSGVAVPTDPKSKEATPVLETYPGSEMSDGERAIFYFLGQCLLAPIDGVIIIDEPEGHVHKAVLGRLWDSIEAARSDCAFIYITHDLDFAAERPASAKYFIRAYDPVDGGRWDIEELPQDTGLPEQVVTELVGSRKPILFVEGAGDSLDLALYRSLYTGLTIVPVGSCEDVIHSVGSYRRNKTLHRLGQVYGLVDADDRSESEIVHLREQDVYVLPVAEVENLLLLPKVFVALAEVLYCANPHALLAALKDEIMSSAKKELEIVCTRYTIRRLDRQLKRITIAAKDRLTMQTMFKKELADVEPTTLFSEIEAKLKRCIDSGDLEGILALYDNKGLLACAAKKLGLGNRKELQEKVGRILGGSSGIKLRDELVAVLPTIPI